MPDLDSIETTYIHPYVHPFIYIYMLCTLYTSPNYIISTQIQYAQSYTIPLPATYHSQEWETLYTFIENTPQRQGLGFVLAAL